MGSQQSGLKSKHGVSFVEATTVFDDPFSWTFPDPDHSEEEDRFITLGTSRRGDLLVIAHTRGVGTVRIISARKTTSRERRFYEKKE